MTLLEKYLHNLKLPLIEQIGKVERAMKFPILPYFDEIAEQLGQDYEKPAIGEKFCKINKNLANYFNHVNCITDIDNFRSYMLD